MKKPLHSFFNLGNSQPKAPTFGQKRADQLESRLNQAFGERKKLVRAEFASDKPLDETYRQKAGMVENKIDRLLKDRSDTNE